eukprot:TRINITY_DN9613_c0_g1_i3.p2 TRINITY_DN9613_c0_g1~~TRINITY_DN9613_c0_g1_i3.p2  ORF type:complete len:152 (+),score=12.60 TRINITY_DN9613_c0_g1_i3:100-555(+)
MCIRDSICMICQKSFDSHQKIRITHCQHVFHDKCLKEQIIQTNTTCIICQQQLLEYSTDPQSQLSDKKQYTSYRASRFNFVSQMNKFGNTNKLESIVECSNEAEEKSNTNITALQIIKQQFELTKAKPEQLRSPKYSETFSKLIAQISQDQ